MRWEVLGPVRAWRDGTEVDLGPPQQRAVLALLLARAGEPVRVREVVATLWQEPPASAANVIHRYVGRLRRALQPELAAREPGRWLTAADGGYRLSADADSLDLIRFRHLMEQAWPARDVRLFADALALWKGRAAEGITAEALTRPVFARLDAAFVDCLTEAADLALDRGQSALILPVLHRATGWHPLHEGLHARLVRALAATTGRAAAIERFTGVREMLSTELAVSPGPELREAHRAVPGGEPAAAPEPTGPRQLPAALPVFAGRRAEVDRVLARLPAFRPDGHAPGRHAPGRHAAGGRAPAIRTPGGHALGGHAFDGHAFDGHAFDGDHRGGTAATVLISAIGGMAGVGKTTLAVHLAQLLAGRYPDGQLYVNLRGFDLSGSVLSPADALRGFLDALGVPPQRVPEGEEALAALYRSVLAGQRVLVVLDNARDAAHARPLLPGSPGCLVLVTSRDRMAGLVAGEGAVPLMLEALNAAEGRESLVNRLGAARVAADPAAVDEIVALTAGLPLALAVVAARAAAQPGFPLAAIAAELRESAGSLDAYADTDPATDPRTVFSWSYRALSPAAARLFRLLALHPGPEISAAAGAALAGGPIEAALAELAGAHLIIEQSPGRFAFHDLLRDYAHELAEETDPPGERRAAVGRMLDHYLRHAYATASALGPPLAPLPDEAPSTVKPIRAEAPSTVKPIRVEAPATVEPAPVEVPSTVEPATREWFRREWRVLAAAVELAAGDGFEAYAWRLAWTLERFLEHDGHWHEWALTQEAAVRAARRLGDPRAIAHATRGAGRAYSLLRHYDRGRLLLDEALGLYTGLGDVTGEAYTRFCLGWVCTRQERHEQGVAQARRSVELYRRAGHRSGEAEAMNLFGWLQILLGRYESGLRLSRRAVALSTELGNEPAASRAWDTVAYAHHHLGRYAEAVAAYQSAIELFRAGGDRYHEACTMDRLADSLHAAGDTAAARRTWRTALAVLTGLDPPWADEVRAKLTAVAAVE